MHRLAPAFVLVFVVVGACTPSTPPPAPGKAAPRDLPPALVADDCTGRCGTFPPRDLVGCDAHAGEDLWMACCARVRAQTERVPSLCRAAKDCSLAPHVSPYSPDLMSACAD